MTDAAAEIVAADKAACGGLAPDAVPAAPKKPLSSTLFDLMLWAAWRSS